MTCNEPITPLSTSGTGELSALTCCDDTPPQEQELVRRWKQVRRDVFSTTPIPFGVASFSTSFGFSVNGPALPGTSTGPVLGWGGTIDPPSSERPLPNNDRISEIPD